MEFLQKPLPSDNFNINNKNVIPNKYILVFDIQIKSKMCKMVKINLYLEIFVIYTLTMKL